MKNIFKYFMAALVVTGFASCEDEQDLKYVTPAASFQILTPQSGESVVLNPENLTNPALVLSWEDANYGTPTEVTYTVQAAANGTDFATPIDIATTSNTFASIDVASLNTVATSAGLMPFTESGLDIRIKSSVGAQGSEEGYSNTITYLVTPFSTELPKLAVVGNHNGWSFDNPPILASSAYGQTDYEGYVWLDGEFKFVMPNNMGVFAWPDAGGGPNYGAGANAGTIAENGGNLTATAGYYLVKVDTDALTYSITAMNWGVIGNATPTGWDSDTDMVYNPDTRLLTVTLSLIPQAAPDNGMKFRANDDWGVNYGDSGADGTLDLGGTNIGIENAGTYLITMDLSHPRAYTYSLELQ